MAMPENYLAADFPVMSEHELRRFYIAGRIAGEEGKHESACPLHIPALRAQWLAGWDSAQ